jgi:septum formation protein
MTMSQTDSAPTLVLASSSPYRRQLLERLGLRFSVDAPQVDERPLAGEAAAALVNRLALLKARTVAHRQPGAIVIGSDQVAVRENEVLGKPETEAAAIDQLSRSSAMPVEFLTAVAVIDGRQSKLEPLLHLDVTRVQFRPLEYAEIESYVARDKPLDCAGGFRCEGLGIALFERIDSRDPTGLIGLPLIWLSGALRELGFKLL